MAFLYNSHNINQFLTLLITRGLYILVKMTISIYVIVIKSLQKCGFEIVANGEKVKILLQVTCLYNLFDAK